MVARSRARGRSTRKKASREDSKLYYIFCEGVTETDYFKKLKNTLLKGRRDVALNIEPLGKAGDPRILLKKALRQMEGLELEQAWLVFDCEPQDPNRCKIARETFFRKTVVTPIISFPSFELWLILHKESPSPSLVDSAAKAEERLVKLVPGMEQDGYQV